MHPDFTQRQMQAFLEAVHEKEGLPAALQRLREWSITTGYIRPDDLRLNRSFHWPDETYGLTFRAQVNVLRSRYTPQPQLPEVACPICFENIAAPGRENLRAFELTLAGRSYFLHLTPFPLFPGHFVLVQKQHVPMRVDRNSVADLLAFVRQAPHVTACSNSDVEWAGASILSHHHYQIIENLHLPVMDAAPVSELRFRCSRRGAEAAMLHYPCPCIKITCPDAEVFVELCARVIEHWKMAVPGKNTCNLIVMNGPAGFTGYVFLRNPDFRTAAEFQEIKSEGVGVIEMAGEGIYPVPAGDEASRLWSRIRQEGLEIVKGIIRSNSPITREHFADIFRDFAAVLSRAC